MIPRWQSILAALIAFLQSCNGQVPGIFLEEPTSVTVVEGDTAVFRCRVDASAVAVGWLVNGTSFNQLSNPDIGLSAELSQDGGPPINTLTIVGRSDYNGTTVQCVALFFGGDDHFSSTSVTLIQGPFNAVSDLTVALSETTLTVTWIPPFSLDLSYFEVDILYRVEVCKLNESEAYNCSSEVVGQPEYSFTEQADELFQFIVTPLSPRRYNTSLEGTASQPVTGYFLGAPYPITSGMDLLMTRVTLVENEVFVTTSFPLAAVARFPGRIPDTYKVYGETIDPAVPVRRLKCVETTGQEADETVILNFYCSNLFQDRLYYFVVEARNEIGSTNSSINYLSTHDISDVKIVNVSTPGTINITCTFAENADAIGYFVILYPANNSIEHTTQYRYITKDTSTRDTLTAIIEELDGQSYDVVVFDVEADGLPEEMAVALPYRVYIGNSESVYIDVAETNFVEVIASGNEICLSCSNLNCVAVIHTAASSTDDQKLMKVYVLASDNDTMTCSGYLPPDLYAVAVFDDLHNNYPNYTDTVSIPAPIPPSITPSGLSVGAIAGLTVGVILVALLTFAVLFVAVWRCKQQSGGVENETGSGNGQIETKTNSAYEMRHIIARPGTTTATRPSVPEYETVY